MGYWELKVAIIANNFYTIPPALAKYYAVKAI